MRVRGGGCRGRRSAAMPGQCRLRALGAALACAAATPTHAVNWLALQGTEPPDAKRVQVFGFIQPEYQYTDGTPLDAGPYAGTPAAFNTIAPDQDSHAEFDVRRARIGVRGVPLPSDPKTNYFLLVEAGNNGITSNGGGTVRVTDASVTLNHIPGARLRIGQFKYPGSEEGLLSIQVFDYVNYTTVTNSLMTERFFDSDGSVAGLDANRPNGPTGAFRDIGVQVFDWFVAGGWEHSYAAMLANGNGITRGDDNDAKDVHLYWASELVLAGKGARREGLKLYAWHQQGERTLAAGPAQTVADFDRTRWGLGATWRRGKYRAGAEYIRADGMIFTGADGGAVAGTPNATGTAVASNNVLPDDEADGWYVDFGYRVTPKVELDLRYDRYDRATDTAAEERRFDTLTFGLQYFFSADTRGLINYELRDAEAPRLPGDAVANQILDSLDDRIALQVITAF